MAKGIILIDIPMYCQDCDCLDNEHWCGVTGYSIYNGRAEKYCPIKELPEKQVRDYPEYDKYIAGYDDGWDACIDEILGE